MLKFTTPPIFFAADTPPLPQTVLDKLQKHVHTLRNLLSCHAAVRKAPKSPDYSRNLSLIILFPI